MLIGPNAVVSFSYTLTNEQGDIIDQSPEGESMTYLHGTSSIIPGLENELVGKVAGNEFDVTVQPENGYGERIEEMVQKMPRSTFPADAEIELGMQFGAETAQGQVTVVVTEIEDDFITVDGNHPLVGMTLRFVGKVEAVRKATAEELDHGHAH
jgi:FKBP-type peptidyl-prolyl cis-trans isomerase SlyD